MKTYEHFATTLKALLGDDQAVRITASGFMPLSVESIGKSGDGRDLIAISHTSVQNGDLMRDPEIVFELIQYPASPPDGMRLITRAEWRKTHRDYRGEITGQPAILELDAGKTVLSPVCIAEIHAEPISFRSDYAATRQEVYRYDDAGRRTAVYPQRKSELRSFARMWFRNLKHQGFLDRDAKREVLA